MKRFAALALFVIWLAGCSTPAPQPLEEPTPQAYIRATEPPYEAAGLGESREQNGFVFTLDRVEKYNPAGDVRPPEGRVWLLFWLTVENNSERAYTVRDYSNYTVVYTDGAPQQLTKEPVVKDAKVIFRNIEPGETLEGYIAAEAPEVFGEVRLRYKFSLLGTQDINFIVNWDEID
ncbi:MAG: DUF4352 domain-containing protein [Clostridia bacterium]|nr:DUF4352 domain-containing protein [Clostridia bacterium]